MKRLLAIMALTALLMFVGCAQGQSSTSSADDGNSSSEPSSQAVAEPSAENAEPSSSSPSPAVSTTAESTESGEAIEVVIINAGGAALEMALADTDAARALVEKLQDGPISLSLHAYGGFEKVGPLPWALPQSDEQITTSAGDVMLYQGDQITIFTGSNSWAYTPLGHIDGATADSLLEAFGDGDVEITMSL